MSEVSNRHVYSRMAPINMGKFSDEQNEGKVLEERSNNSVQRTATVLYAIRVCDRYYFSSLRIGAGSAIISYDRTALLHYICVS